MHRLKQREIRVHSISRKVSYQSSWDEMMDPATTTHPGCLTASTQAPAWSAWPSWSPGRPWCPRGLSWTHAKQGREGETCKAQGGWHFCNDLSENKAKAKQLSLVCQCTSDGFASLFTASWTSHAKSNCMFLFNGLHAFRCTSAFAIWQNLICNQQ